MGVSSGDEYNSASQYRMAVSDSLSRTASQSMQQNGSIRPTLKINQGAQINIFVSRDVNFLDFQIQEALLKCHTICLTQMDYWHLWKVI